MARRDVSAAVAAARRRRPPHLRVGTAARNCAGCRHFDGRGTCRLYDYPVKPSQVCDSYEAR